jgi:cellulose synthase/poly-beta-1,6-N-acetylglucosamine synthase-like glycosyltransferase
LHLFVFLVQCFSPVDGPAKACFSFIGHKTQGFKIYMKITLMIPAYNEELTIRECILSCLSQMRRPDQIIVVNDGSTDSTSRIVEDFASDVQLVSTPKNTGSKSRAQEYGLSFVTGDILVMTDADTILSPNFIQYVEEDFKDPSIHAVAGYIKSVPHNWLTACRELDYIIGQDVHKQAQSNLNSVVVIPGCGAAFRVETFKKEITFEHDTLTEDLDFTYKLHNKNLRIYYDKRAVVYTQDPATLSAYVNQTRRWIGGGWQNLVKHFGVIRQRQGHALEIGLIYVEGMIFGLLFFILPIINVIYFLDFLIGYFTVAFLIGTYGVMRRKRWDLLLYAPLFPFVLILNSLIFLEQFFLRVVMKKDAKGWFKVNRRLMFE